jgi:uncharacterized membrane protein HdeD (DUF308 family)
MSADRELTVLARSVVWTVRFNAVASVALGLMLLFWPGETLFVTALMFGLWLLVHGAARLVEAFGGASIDPLQRGVRAVAGLVLITIAVVVIRDPAASVRVLVVLGAVALLFAGAVELVSAATSRQEGGWWIRGLLGAIAVVASGVALVWPRPTLHAFAVITGVALVLIGVLQFLAVRKSAAKLERLTAT